MKCRALSRVEERDLRRPTTPLLSSVRARHRSTRSFYRRPPSVVIALRSPSYALVVPSARCWAARISWSARAARAIFLISSSSARTTIPAAAHSPPTRCEVDVIERAGHSVGRWFLVPSSGPTCGATRRARARRRAADARVRGHGTSRLRPLGRLPAVSVSTSLTTLAEISKARTR